MSQYALQQPIEELWERRESLSSATGGEARGAVEAALDLLDSGAARVAEPSGSGWQVNQWLKKAVLLSFRLTDSMAMEGPGGAPVWDKVPLKFAGWGENRFRDAGFRAVPGAVVRRSAYIAPGVVLMPSFVNVGAYVGRNTMVDTWATVGSCAQIGANCHLSGGVGIGGVLEPLQANPVIIEDDCFIGARSEVAEGVVVERGSVLSMGVFIGASTKVVDRATGEIHVGRVPAYSVVVPGSLPGRAAAGRLARAVAVLRRDRQDGSTSRREPRPRSTSCCAIEACSTARSLGADPLPLRQALIRCASITPADAGAQTVLADALRATRFHRHTACAMGEIENLFARIGTDRPAYLLRRPHRRRPGRRRQLAIAIRSVPRCGTACSTAAVPAT